MEITSYKNFTSKKERNVKKHICKGKYQKVSA